MLAEYRGECDYCGSRVSVGDQIWYEPPKAGEKRGTVSCNDCHYKKR